ncbi:MAG: dual specificity tyrosine-phosphorylation-regulated kinase 2-like [Trebouxia sp. A1-2]|nr:MAG: dual specificity tyrosine-phosphorylation-regulated kinase 2-like [Trebouxia sp. A1-2]
MSHNLLLCVESGNVGVKLIDLGNCFSLTGTDTSRISFEMQTLPFRAPEALTGGACGAGIDVWSLGCVLAEVALQRPLFPITTISELMHQMTAQLGPLPPSLRSLLPAQASPIMVAQAAPPIHESAHKGTDSVQTSRWAHGQQVGSMCSVPAQAGPLQMWHERASPLHLELAKVDPSMASLVMSMLDYDPQTRMSAAQGLSHPFLRGLSPALQLPQSKAHSSNEPSEQDVTTDKVDFEYTAGSLTGVSLPFKPEPRRQLAVSLPTRASPAIQASSASWTLPLPSDPVLRGPGPQLGPFPPTEPPQPQPPPMVNAQQHSPLKAAQTKLEPPAQSDSQLAPPQLGLDHVPPLILRLLAPLFNPAMRGSCLMLLAQQLTCFLLAVTALLQLWPGNLRRLLQLQTAVLQLHCLLLNPDPRPQTLKAMLKPY